MHRYEVILLDATAKRSPSLDNTITAASASFVQVQNEGMNIRHQAFKYLPAENALTVIDARWEIRDIKC
ncbi:unnamed protein product [Clonostachys byssicola]|uniref:Uncharacterized protein n=1 Tax=Clonostachys byssicola TaxID=160290 RepID=A0A9N9ULC9_9HYPO|nr:unnamed protein product [Clonostachys byssicola]